MPDTLDAGDRLQPRKPSHYRLPTVVQPQWRWADLLAHNPTTDAIEQLSEELCKRYAAKHCLLLDRARSGVYLLCKAFGLDGEWIMPSLMHRPTAVVLANHSAGIAFADCDECMTLSPASAERMISPHTDAILATHTYGKAADIKALRALADRHGLVLIENAVHMASGIKVENRVLGSWGDATMLSFNVDKPLGGILGGALLTSREDIWNAVSRYPLGPPNTSEMRGRLKTTYAAYRLKPLLLKLPGGRKHRGEIDGVVEIEEFHIDKYRSFTPRRIHPLQARVALARLHHEHEATITRTRHARLLNACLHDDARFAVPESTIDRPHAFTYYPLLIRHGKRLKLGEYLANAGVEAKWRYAPLNLQTGLTGMRCDNVQAGNDVWRQHLLLPVGPVASDKQIQYLADTLLGW